VHKPRLLDLFCGAGGVAVGYAKAGFEVVGVDILRQPHYPFSFVQADAVLFPLDGFDVVHASPPCQRYSICQNFLQRIEAYPDLVPVMRRRLLQWGGLWVIENVPGAPMEHGVVLCGSMFGLGVLRHRYFESSVLLFPPGSCHHAGSVKDGTYISVFGKGGRGFTRERGSQAMGIDWMTIEEMRQAIPPAYTEWLGQQLLHVYERTQRETVIPSCGE
jgi:DNA (cytosine-5)-methyltransferase 1